MFPGVRIARSDTVRRDIREERETYTHARRKKRPKRRRKEERRGGRADSFFWNGRFVSWRRGRRKKREDVSMD